MRDAGIVVCEQRSEVRIDHRRPKTSDIRGTRNKYEMLWFIIRVEGGMECIGIEKKLTWGRLMSMMHIPGQTAISLAVSLPQPNVNAIKHRPISSARNKLLLACQLTRWVLLLSCQARLMSPVDN